MPCGRSADGFLQINSLIKTQHRLRSIYGWNVSRHGRSRNRLFRNMNARGRIETLRDRVRQFRNA